MAYNNITCFSAGAFPATAGTGLASYGQTFSSESIDFNNLAAYAPAPYGAAYCPPAPFNPNDPQLLAQVEQICSGLYECKRPMLRRQVVTVPANYQGRVCYINRRLPTPPPDIIERITVIKPPRDVINLCIEKPSQPAPCFQQREVCGKPRKPIIQPRVVCVPPRSNPCAPQVAQVAQVAVSPPPQAVCVSPPPQPVYAPQPQQVYAPAPQPQPVYVQQQQPVYAPPPQPVYAPQPQPQSQPCIPLPQSQPQPQPCIPLPQAQSQQPCIPNSFSGPSLYPQPGLVNSASGFAPGYYGGYPC